MKKLVLLTIVAALAMCLYSCKEEAKENKPTVLFVDDNNKIIRKSNYEKYGQIINKIFDSNINCMSNCSNEKKSLTYFAAASYDRTIRIYSVEDGFKKIKTKVLN